MLELAAAVILFLAAAAICVALQKLTDAIRSQVELDHASHADDLELKRLMAAQVSLAEQAATTQRDHAVRAKAHMERCEARYQARLRGEDVETTH